MSDLDTMLRESLNRLAEPADPSGVAAAIQARVDAAGMSDGGAGGAGGAGGSGFGAWVIPAVIGLAAIGGGLALGAATSGGEGSIAGATAVIVRGEGGIPAASCPGGVTVVSLDPGARVLALSRSDDSAFLAVRDPGNLTRVVWVSSGLTEPDAGSDVAALPVAACVEPSAAASPSAEPSVTPSAEPSETTEPVPEPTGTSKPTPKPTKKPTPKPTPKPDKEKPTIQVGNWSEPEICPIGSPDGPDSSTITVVVGDNVGVTSVTATASASQHTITGPSGSGSQRTFTVSRNGGPFANVVLTFTVKDAAGNSRSASSPALESFPECVG